MSFGRPFSFPFGFPKPWSGSDLDAAYRRVLHRVWPAGGVEGPGDESAGLVLVTDGVGGLDLCGTALRAVATAAGVPLRVRIIPWSHGLGRWHSDLTVVAHHELKGRLLAAEIAKAHAERPERPVFLVGKSGGSGLVVRALEASAPDSVEAAVLLAPALSPDYDLSRALRAIGRDLTVFWSPLDVFVLGVGTRLFGTIDRVHAVSAGLVGFRRPAQADPAAYAKLRQVRWHPRMIPSGNLGGHVGSDNPAFLKRYVMPLLDRSAPAASANRPGDQADPDPGR